MTVTGGKFRLYGESDMVDVFGPDGNVVGRAPKGWARAGLLRGDQSTSRPRKGSGGDQKQPADPDPSTGDAGGQGTPES